MFYESTPSEFLPRSHGETLQPHLKIASHVFKLASLQELYLEDPSRETTWPARWVSASTQSLSAADPLRNKYPRPPAASAQVAKHLDLRVGPD